MTKKLLAIIFFLQKLTNKQGLMAKAIKSLSISRPICLLDVGSAKGMMSRWEAIKEEVYVYGFEPDSDARNILDQKTEFIGGGNIDSPYALSDKKETLELNILKKPSHSSVLEPNHDLLNLYPMNQLEHYELDFKTAVDASDLDSLNFAAKDFIKIDVQGYELKVLQGAESSLMDILGLEVEVEFLELYKNQCSFGELKDYLFKHDFEFIDFTSLTRWQRDAYRNSLGNCMGADALFLRSPEYVLAHHKEDIDKLKAYLSICLIYKRYDLICITLKLFSLDKSKDFIKFFKISTTLRRRLHAADRVSRFSNHIIGFCASETDNSRMFY